MNRIRAQVLGALVAAAAAAPAAARGDAVVSWDAPELFVAGESFVARVEVTARRGDVDVPVWYLTAAAFDADGRALGARSGREAIPVAEGDTLTATIDLSGPLGERGDFALAHAGDDAVAIDVDALEPAPEGLDFTRVNQGALAEYLVHLRTNAGDMLLELWANDAPSHVRNFLDLAYTGFYDGTTFHRVLPGFMIQGGDPEGTGNGSGPRTLRAEFNERSHRRGVLSMARGSDPNSASCQFFVMHADAPNLDGQYTAFGRLITGFGALDRIATAAGRPIPGTTGFTPFERQIIERATIVLADSRRN